MLPTRLAGVESSGGEAVLPVQGEALMPHHATWFNNTEQTTLTISPAAWKNEVITCYLKTEVPVALAGVRWLYGEPAMVEGFTYVVALQQIDAATVLANLAYSLKQ